MDIILVGSVEFTKRTHWQNHIHLGLLTLREVLKPHFSVDIIDFDYLYSTDKFSYENDYEVNVKNIAQYITLKKPKIVGFYTMSCSFDVSVRVAQHVKNNDSSIKIVFGGPQATHTYKSCLTAFDFVDAIALGESEFTAVDLMQSLIGYKDIKDVPGIAYRAGDASIIRNESPKRLAGTELVKYSIQDYSPYTFPTIAADEALSIPLEGGRGCPFNCTFCATSIFWERNFRLKNIDDLFNEFIYYYDKFKISHFSIMHDLFTADHERLMEFCNKLIESNRPFTWGCSSRTDVLKIEMLKHLKKAGCRNIYLGIETASPRMQKIIKKNLNLETALNVIRECMLVKINITASFIYGFPDETIDDFKETVMFIESLFKELTRPIVIQMHCFQLYPMTFEYEKVKDIMYYSPEKSKPTLYHNKMDEISVSLVKAYPDMFSHCYVFDTEVRLQYPFFDTLVICFSALFSCFKLSVKHVIGKYGLLTLYTMMEDIITDIHNERNASENFVIDSTFINYEDDDRAAQFFIDLCRREIGTDYNGLLAMVFSYEKAFYDYARSNSTESLVVKTDFDITEAYRSKTLVKTEQYIRFYKKNKIFKQGVLSPAGLLKALSGEARNQIKPIAFQPSTKQAATPV
ncbi:MAG: B12-binding domain-containing radical SAM protein [Defluviitaleaceae bacterium]|nr:B12-binding domain-containing radical SAM protein [Defluviitaleaceae bacterium]